MDTAQIKGQIFMVGTGGQGILLLARALAEIAARDGSRVISSETHGMAMRGGTVTANLKIGPYSSPLIPAGSADLLIGLDENESKAYLHMLAPGGISVVNAREQGPFDHVMDATSLALSSRMPGAVNMFMLGFVLRILGVPMEGAKQVLGEISPGKVLDGNIRAMETGYAYRHQESS